MLLLSPTQANGACIFGMDPSTPDYNTSKITVTAKNISPDSKGPFSFESNCGSVIGRRRGVSTTVNGSYLEATYPYIKGSQSCEFSLGPHRINFLDKDTPICWADYTVVASNCTLTLTLNGKDITNQQVPWNERTGTLNASIKENYGAGATVVVLKTPIKSVTSSGSFNLTDVREGEYFVSYEKHDAIKDEVNSRCSASFLVLGAGQTPIPNWGNQGQTQTCTKCGRCPGKSDPPDYQKCLDCFDKGTDPNYGPGSWSALGCIPTSPDKFIQWLLEKAINIVGGIAFLLILFGSFRVATSSGNPEALNEGKDIIFAALAGLLFIVFSVVLLKIIGADILQIPGFQ